MWPKAQSSYDIIHENQFSCFKKIHKLLRWDFCIQFFNNEVEFTRRLAIPFYRATKIKWQAYPSPPRGFLMNLLTVQGVFVMFYSTNWEHSSSPMFHWSFAIFTRLYLKIYFLAPYHVTSYIVKNQEFLKLVVSEYEFFPINHDSWISNF